MNSFLDGKVVIVGEVLDGDEDGIEEHEKTGSGGFEICSDGLFEAGEFDVG